MGVYLRQVLQDSKQLLISPKIFFSNVSKETGYKDAIIRAIIFGLLTGIISLIWNIIGIAPTPSMFVSVISSLIVFPLAAIIGLYIAAFFMWIISLICACNATYLDNVRIQSYLLVLMPINAFLTFTSRINIILGIIISAVVIFYGLWLLYNAIVVGLNGKKLRAQIIIWIFAMIMLFLYLFSIIALKTAANFLKKSGITMQEMRELQNNPEEAQKKIQEMMEKYMQEQGVQ